MDGIDLEELCRPCPCGHDHPLDVDEIVVAHDALRRLGAELADGFLSIYESPLLVCDENTLAATRDRIADVLRTSPCIVLEPEGLHADEAAIAAVERALPDECDLMIAVGSGTIHDICRYMAKRTGIPFVSCPTAASVDGFLSTGAAMTLEGMKTTVPAVSPAYVIADTAVLAAAPYRLTASGMSDLFGKYVCIADWRIAHEVTGEYICERICDMALEAVREVHACMDDLRSGEEGPYAKLISALLLSGLAMQMTGNSRPASCAEHHLSHFWEMRVINGPLDALHGEQVGVGLLMVARHYHQVARAIREGRCEVVGWEGLPMSRLEQTYGASGLMAGVLRENTPDPLAAVDPARLREALPAVAGIIGRDVPDPDELEALLARGGCCTTMADLGLAEELAAPSMELAPYVRARLSFERMTKMLRVS